MSGDARTDPLGIVPSTTDGDVMTTVGGVASWAALGAVGGFVESIVEGPGISVDATDPDNPIVSAPLRELLMADGVTSPPIPIETEAGDDWLYQD